MTKPSRAALPCTVALAAMSAGCTGSSARDDVEGWIELGWGDPFEPLDDGDALAMTIGSQGARMFPVAVRAGGFALERDKDAADVATVDVILTPHPEPAAFPDIEFVVEAMPVDLREQDDGTWLFYYVPLIVDDMVDVSRLVEQSADLEAEIHLRARSASFFTHVVLQEVPS
jgi:hypothetical protein